MSEFLPKWLNIIRSCSFDNTYKMAWSKAITEIALDIDYENCPDQVEITLQQIANKIVRYYWDQTVHFNLIQGSNPLKPPRILTITKDLINTYQEKVGSNQPVKFFKSRVENLCKSEFDQSISDIASTLKLDVSYRFISLSGKNIGGIYDYRKSDDYLIMARTNLKELKNNYAIVVEAINYRWAQILEGFNHSPRICKKVRIIDEQEIRRSSLGRFKRYLELDNPEHICFVCGEKILEEQLSIDHIIPWSFLYSDDLWNLVFVDKKCNSQKSNRIPDEKTIQRLEARNEVLLRRVTDEGIKDKQVSDLQFAIDDNLVRKFWVGCQG